MNPWFGPWRSKWPVVPLREYAALGTGHTPSRENSAYWENCTIPWVTVEDIRANGVDSFNPLLETIQKISELGLRNSAAVLHPPGTVMLSRTASIGFSCIIGCEMATTQAFVTWTPKKTYLDSTYLLAVLRTMRQHYFAISYGATHLTIYFPDIKTLRVPLPPLADQVRIAKYIEYETARIDALIEKQQQLIALLKEKRQAVISHAVTKGLNPNAPMRDSGVEWLGEVPAHWTVCRIKQIAQLESGHTPSKSVAEYWLDCSIPWVSLNDTKILKQVDYLEDTAVHISEKGMQNSSAHILPAGCVVFTRDATIGLAAITTREMAVSQHIIAWVCDPSKVFSEFVLLVFYAMEAELNRFTFGATLKTIGMPDVKRLTGAFPPLDEQAQIVEHVFKMKEALTASITKSEQILDILAERRTALISAAVTGKIDVRNWQPPRSESAAA